MITKFEVEMLIRTNSIKSVRVECLDDGYALSFEVIFDDKTEFYVFRTKRNNVKLFPNLNYLKELVFSMGFTEFCVFIGDSEEKKIEIE